MAKYNTRRNWRKRNNGKRKFRIKRRSGKRGGGGGIGASRRRLTGKYDKFDSARFSGYPGLKEFGVNSGTTAPRRNFVPASDVRLGENVSATYISIGSKRRRYKPPIAKMSGRRSWLTTSVHMVNSTSGQQALTVFSYNDQTYMNSLRSDLTSAVGDIGGTAAASNSFNMWLGNQKVELEIKNQSDSVYTGKLYSIIPKVQSGSTTWDTPQEAWTNGMAEQYPTGQIDSIWAIPGQTPFESRMFNKRFKVLKVTQLYLEPGETRIISTYRNFNYMFNTDRFESSGPVIQGLTWFQMLVGHGGIGHEVADTAASVTYMPSRLDIIRKQRISAGAVPQSAAVTKLFSNAILTTGSTFVHMGEADDVEKTGTVA